MCTNRQSPGLVNDWVSGTSRLSLRSQRAKTNPNVLIVHDGGAISSHGLLFDDTDELKGAAERSVGVGPFRTLEVSHLQNVVVL